MCKKLENNPFIIKNNCNSFTPPYYFITKVKFLRKDFKGAIFGNDYRGAPGKNIFDFYFFGNYSSGIKFNIGTNNTNFETKGFKFEILKDYIFFIQILEEKCIFKVFDENLKKIFEDYKTFPKIKKCVINDKLGIGGYLYSDNFTFGNKASGSEICFIIGNKGEIQENEIPKILKEKNLI